MYRGRTQIGVIKEKCDVTEVVKYEENRREI